MEKKVSMDQMGRGPQFQSLIKKKKYKKFLVIVRSKRENVYTNKTKYIFEGNLDGSFEDDDKIKM